MPEAVTRSVVLLFVGAERKHQGWDGRMQSADSRASLLLNEPWLVFSVMLPRGIMKFVIEDALV